MFQNLKQSLVNETCRFYRSAFLKKTVFIGVTGSCGKTTTKELIAAVLSTRFRGKTNVDTCNGYYHVVRTILRARPSDDYCVLEVAAAATTRSPVGLQADLIRPKIAVVTNIGMDHIDLFGSPDAIAAEKGKLVAVLPPDGTAILNADDSRVLAMRSQFAGSVITYGTSSAAMLRAEDINSAWPNRLSFTAQYDGQSTKVETQLCGTHWVPNVLAAMAVGYAMGIPLGAAAAAIRNIPPVNGRMSVLTTADGIAFVRDHVKAPVWTIPASIEFMDQANAKRKIMVFGNLSDYQEPLDPTYLRVAREARTVSDFVFFVGRWASRCLRAKRHADDQTVQAFVTADHLVRYLSGFLRTGDLVLIKGSEYADRLEQVVPKLVSEREGSHATNEVGHKIIDDCNPDPVTNPWNEAANCGSTLVVIGLGNPGRKFERTPHNVGQRAVDLIAESLGADWTQAEFGMIARSQWPGCQIILIKPSSFMNDTGPLLRRIAKQLEFESTDCVLIHDDINLEPGIVRNRMNGSAGGHNGVQSIIAAFQTEEFRRVKIGVGRPTNPGELVRHVLKPIEATQRDVIEKACREAADRVLTMIRSQANKTASLNRPAVQ